MDRRGFAGALAGATAALCAVAAIPAAWTRPVLYGDGVHDDTDALQALFDGHEVTDARDWSVIRPASFALNRRAFRLSRTLNTSGPCSGSITNCVFRWAEYPYYMPQL